MCALQRSVVPSTMRRLLSPDSCDSINQKVSFHVILVNPFTQRCVYRVETNKDSDRCCVPHMEMSQKHAGTNPFETHCATHACIADFAVRKPNRQHHKRNAARLDIVEVPNVEF